VKKAFSRAAARLASLAVMAHCSSSLTRWGVWLALPHVAKAR
jgi:hypothetical protein